MATASGWNVYFDTTTTPMLCLNNAVIEAVNSFDEPVYADSDLLGIQEHERRMGYSGSAREHTGR
ncbi:MAG TPA: hypothetical protein PKU80_01020 [Candidatus Limiplasma sp.]|nr:hypothetical protein [Candidatus Limiplasma sp.]HRX09257.1 hypothetical protein [Candidatus Limiplasma sp.]